MMIITAKPDMLCINHKVIPIQAWRKVAKLSLGGRWQTWVSELRQRHQQLPRYIFGADRIFRNSGKPVQIIHHRKSFLTKQKILLNFSSRPLISFPPSEPFHSTGKISHEPRQRNVGKELLLNKVFMRSRVWSNTKRGDHPLLDTLPNVREKIYRKRISSLHLQEEHVEHEETSALVKQFRKRSHRIEYQGPRLAQQITVRKSGPAEKSKENREVLSNSPESPASWPPMPTQSGFGATIPEIDIQGLTNQVVARINERVIAHRERMGRI